ncbi:hypothetical protein [Priestia aryabhattai]|uniref:hypothetical protein n=1 Tax=Priestia aryabhattai TaxID=412384 RepID=UPI00126A1BF8|nr:hypothetical protein [Priestia aryabhattai]
MKKKEAVQLFGSENCKAHFARYGKFKNKSIEDALITTLKQHYRTVNIIKQGRSFVYELDSKRKVIAERPDKRSSNGAWSIPYTRNMDMMVVASLDQGIETENAQTLSRWAVQFGLITGEMYGLLKSQYDKGLREFYIKKLQSASIISFGEERILDDFTGLTKEINGQLAGALERMKKTRIIEIDLVYKGHIKETDKTVNLYEDTIQQILILKRRLMEEYQVNSFFLLNYCNAKKVKDYNKKWKTELEKITDHRGEKLGLDYFYKTFLITMNPDKKTTIDYLEKYNKKVIREFNQDQELFLVKNENTFHKLRHNYVIEKAKRKQQRFLSENILTLDEEMEMFYNAEELSRERFKFDKQYYALYFDKNYVKRIKKLQEYYANKP